MTPDLYEVSFALSMWLRWASFSIAGSIYTKQEGLIISCSAAEVIVDVSSGGFVGRLVGINLSE